MENKFKWSFLIFLFFFFGCVSSNKTARKEGEWSPELSVRMGINKGGIVENTDFSELETAEVDAYTGATSTGIHAGAHAEMPLFINSLETGIDYMYNSQTFNYDDERNNFSGDRKLGVSQFMLPVTYNFGLFRNELDEHLFSLKIGFMFQYNLLNVTNTGLLPDYSYNRFSNGPVFGLETIPIVLNNGSKLGFYCNFYRGSQLYKDFYNKPEFDTPGSAFFRAGISYYFNQ